MLEGIDVRKMAVAFYVEIPKMDGTGAMICGADQCLSMPV